MFKVLRTIALTTALVAPSAINAEVEFSSILQDLAPVEIDIKEGALEEHTSAKKYKIDDAMIDRVVGENRHLTRENMMDAQAGDYIVLDQTDLSSQDTVMLLQKTLTNQSDIHVVLDVHANKAGALELFSSVQTKYPEGNKVRKRIIPDIQHLHLVNTTRDIKRVGRSFLYGDRSLESISFTGFEQVTEIEDGFLVLCPVLTSADLSSLSSLETVRDFFAASCSSLSTVSMPKSKKLTTVGSNFMRNTTSMTALPQGTFQSVKTVGDYFMRGSGVTTLLSSHHFKQLSNLGSGFMAESKLTSAEVAGFKRLKSGGDHLLKLCSSLTAENIEGAGALSQGNKSLYKKLHLSYPGLINDGCGCFGF